LAVADEEERMVAGAPIVAVSSALAVLRLCAADVGGARLFWRKGAWSLAEGT